MIYFLPVALCETVVPTRVGDWGLDPSGGNVYVGNMCVELHWDDLTYCRDTFSKYKSKREKEAF